MMFDDRYEAVLADTVSSREINFKLRYRVFCIEKGFEDPTGFANQMEQDPYDAHSVHFLVRDKKRSEWMAAARLVIGAADTLPMARSAQFDLPNLPSDTMIAEFSRFLILDGHRKTGSQGAPESEILFGLIRAAREYSRRMGIQHWLFFCRRALCRMLNNAGVAVEPIGPTCIFRGVRIPYLMDLQTAFENVPGCSPRTHQLLSRPWKSFVPYSSYITRSTTTAPQDRFSRPASGFQFGGLDLRNLRENLPLARGVEQRA